MKNTWTPEEDQIVRKIWASNEPVQFQMHLLPGRTYFAMRHRASVIKCRKRQPGPYPQMERNVMKLIRDHGPICAAQMAQMLLCSPQQVDQYVRRLHRAKRIHVGDYVEVHENHLSRCFVAGRGEDLPKPPKASRPKFIAPARAEFKADPLMAALFARAI